MNRRICVLVFASLGAACGPSSPAVPETQVCRSPASTASIDTAAVRSIVTSATLADGDTLPFTIGGQGATMLGVQLVLSGPAVPSCIAQTTSVFGPAGETWASATVPLPTSELADGGFVTGELWLFPTFEAGGEATVRVESYGVTHEVRVRLE